MKKRHHISNRSELIGPKYHETLYFGLIISIIHQICMKAFNYAGRTELSRGPHAACGIENPALLYVLFVYDTFGTIEVII